MSIVHLVTELCCITSATLSFLINFYIIVCFVKTKTFQNNFRLPLYLAITDLGYSIAALIHVGYLTLNWTDDSLDYNPYFIIISNSFLPALVKVMVVISCSMALDRSLALLFPLVYRRINKKTYADVAVIIAFIWFIFDYCFQIFSASFQRVPGCATMACFVHQTFLRYVSYSNTIAGFLIAVLSMFVFVGVHKFSRSEIRTSIRMQLKTTILSRQANRITVGILLTSLFFVTIPSILVTGYKEVTGTSLFSAIGPFYILAILTNGLCDGFVFYIVNSKQIGFGKRKWSASVSRAPICV